jgi:CRISPR-associated protein Cmr1
MHTITLKCNCNIITPMFLSGADGKTPELRAPSIKGAIRFWWRAMNGHLSPEDLKRKETAIFGGSGEKDGRSKVIIKIDKFPEYDGQYKYNPVPHENFRLPAFEQSEEFSITFSLVQNITYKNKIIFDLEKLKDLFILTSVLGGLGKRARRGFGCFQIIEVDNKPFSFDYSISSISNLLNPIEPTFKIENDKIVMNKEAHLEAIYPYVKEIELGEKVKEYGDLLLKISKNSSVFDCYYTGFAERIYLKNRLENKRLSSPIYISILSNNGFYHPIITTLNCAFEKDVFDRLKNERKKSDFSKNFKQAILAGGNYDG